MAYDSDYDELDEEDYDEDDSDDSDDSDEYDDSDMEDDSEDDDDMMKSAIESLTNMEEHIISQSEEQAVIQKSMMVFAEALHSLISMMEEQQESITTLKSRLGVMANTPSTSRQPVMNDTPQVSNADRVSINKTKLLDIIKRGMSNGAIALEDVSYFESTGKMSQRMQELIDLEAK
jgi:hypothetical protein